MSDPHSVGIHPAAWAAVAAGGLLAIGAIVASVRALSRRRLLFGLPTSKARGVFLGYVELDGTAESRQPLTSYLSDNPCVYYTWTVEERWSRTEEETYEDDDGDTQTREVTQEGWTRVAEGGEMISFFLKDETGYVHVVPDRATIEPGVVLEEEVGRDHPLYYERGPREELSDSDGIRRFYEDAIPVGTRLFVAGHARLRKDAAEPEIAFRGDSPIYLISIQTQRKVARGYGRTAWGWGLLGLLPALAGVLFGLGFGSRGPLEEADRLMGFSLIAAAAAYGLAWLLGWAWMAYNSLVRLHQQVRQAWSQVDVELARRQELLPPLVSIVAALRDHERTVESELSLLRGQLGATPPGQPGPDHDGCAPVLRSVTERYPELKSQSAFVSLQDQLTQTEQSIALARAYFNDLATYHNTRLETIPDRFLARLSGLRPEILMTAENFERALVRLDRPGEKTRPPRPPSPRAARNS